MPPIDAADLHTLVAAWDLNGDGMVSASDFKAGLRSIDFSLSDEEADCLCRALDSDGQGNIRLEALQQILSTPGIAGAVGGGDNGPAAQTPSAPAAPARRADRHCRQRKRLRHCRL